MALGKIRRWLCRKSGDGSRSGIRSWVVPLFFLRSQKAVSGFRSWLWWKAILKPQDVARGETLVSVRILRPNSVDQAQFLQSCQMFVQGRNRHFRIVRQPRLRREAAEVGVVPVAQKPQYDLGGRLKPTLLDCPDRCLMAHGCTLRTGRTRLVKPLSARAASASSTERTSAQPKPCAQTVSRKTSCDLRNRPV